MPDARSSGERRAGSRSRYLSLSAIAAVAILAAAVAAAGASARSHSASAKVKPVKGGTLRVQASGTPDCLDPQRTAASASNRFFDAVVAPLLKVTPRGKYVGYVAQSWKTSADGLTVTFKIRKGLRFSNGHALDANDVKWTMDRARDPATNSPVSGPQLKAVQRVDVVDRYTVRLTLSAPSRPLLANLTSAYQGILDKEAFDALGPDQFCKTPVGAGPFMITDVGPAFSTLTMVRNPYFHIPWVNNSGPAYLSRIEWTRIADEPAAASALLSGQIDLSAAITSQYSRILGQPGIKVFRFPSTSQQWLGFNTSIPPFNNPQIRRAVGEVIDRAALIKAARNGLGSVAKSPLPLLMPFYSKDARKYVAPYDPAEARRILAPLNLTVDFLIGLPADNAPTAQLVQAWLAQAGVKVNIVQKDDAGYFEAAQRGASNMWLNAWGCSDPDCLRSFFLKENIGPGGSNFTRVDDPILNSYFQQGMTATTDAAAAAAYAKVQRRINEQAYVIPLWDRVSVFALQNRVKGFLSTPIAGTVWQDIWIKP